MRGSVQSYLRLQATCRDHGARDHRCVYASADDWYQVAHRRDQDGTLLTPMRAALSRIRDPWLRRFLRDLLPEELEPSAVAAFHGIPMAAQAWFIDAAVDRLRREHERLVSEERYGRRVGWVSQSESQRNAMLAGEAVA